MDGTEQSSILFLCKCCNKKETDPPSNVEWCWSALAPQSRFFFNVWPYKAPSSSGSSSQACRPDGSLDQTLQALWPHHTHLIMWHHYFHVRNSSDITMSHPRSLAYLACSLTLSRISHLPNWRFLEKGKTFKNFSWLWIWLGRLVQFSWGGKRQAA